MKYNIISSGSVGNCVILDNSIMIDLGLPYAKVLRYLDDIEYLLLTHKHGDHFNLSAILSLVVDYPDIEIIGSSDIINILIEYGIKTLHVVGDEWLNFGTYKFKSFDLKHDVNNIGYKIVKNTLTEDMYLDTYRVFYATDTRDLFEVEAIDFDLYMIEFNHSEPLIKHNVIGERLNGYSYSNKAQYNHQSNERAITWLRRNNGANALVVPLHISTANNSLEAIKVSLKGFNYDL